jgi:putative DNA primase/helicase
MKQYDYLPIEQAREALGFINTQDDRDEWVRIGKALQDEYGDEAFDLWDSWSSAASSYRERDARTVWRSLGRMNGGSNPVSIATVIYAAKQGGWKHGKMAAPDPAAAARRETERAARREEAARLHAEDQSAAAAFALDIWEKAEPANDNHPYLQRKRVPAYGLRTAAEVHLPNADGELFTVRDPLIIPILSGPNQLSSIQVIAPNGRKSFLVNGRTDGCYAKIGNAKGPSIVAIAEGYATAASWHRATGHTVVIAFNAGNMPKVARDLRAKLPEARLLMVADNDYHAPGEKDDKGRLKTNAGLLKAIEAAEESGCEVYFPPEPRKQDFNDLHLAAGLDVLVEIFNDGDMIDLARQYTAVPVPAAPVATVPANDDKPAAAAPAGLMDASHRRETAAPVADGFLVLGYNDDLVYILPKGSPQVQALTARGMTENGLLKLASLHYWQHAFPHDKAPFSRTDAVDYIFRLAHKKGVFDPRRIRGRGAWRDAERLLFHFGDHLLVDGVRAELQEISTKYVYPAALPFPELADTPLTEAEGEWLIAICNRFRWSKPGSAALLAGWIMLAPVCGSLRWRPHIWLTGGPGCGKSTILEDFVFRLLRGIEVYAQGNSTEAGLRQEIRGDAVPVLFEEGEQNDERETARMQAVLSLIRQASSESGAKTFKGTAGGRSLQFHIRSMFCLASVMVGIKHQADRERLTLLTLRSKPEKDTQDAADAAANWEVIKDELHRVRADENLSRRLFTRSIRLLPVILEAVKVFGAQAARFFGNQRDGDQFGTLLAGAWCLMHDTVPTPEEALDLIQSYDWREHNEETKTDDAMEALTALMGLSLRANGGGEYTVFELVNKIRKGHQGEGDAQNDGVHMLIRECDNLLQRYGIRVSQGQILVDAASDKLCNLLRHTQYAGDLRGYLKRVPGVTVWPKVARIHGVPRRVMAIPLTLITD